MDHIEKRNSFGNNRKRRKKRHKRILDKKEIRLRKRKLKKTIELYLPEEIRKIKSGTLKNILVWTSEIVAVCLLAIILVWAFGQRVSNAGDSMQPGIENGDVVLVNRIVYNVRSPKRGEVIVYKQKGDYHYSVKRVAALPGETIQIKDGKIYIDGEQMEDHIFVSDIENAGVAKKEINLGEDEFFVIGDNHTGSEDSRDESVGMIDRDDILGEAWMVTGYGETSGFIKD